MNRKIALFADSSSGRQIPPQLLVRSLARPPQGSDAPDAEVLIYGDIGETWYGESVTAQRVVEQLQGLQAAHILVRINSYGGSVTDGLAIYNALRGHGAKITCRVEGIAASIASLIAMAGDQVEMFGNTLMMIHAPWTIAMGNSAEMRQMADVLDTYAKAMSTSYARKTGKPLEDITALLTDGRDHWYTAAEAVAEKFADTVSDEPNEQDEATQARLEPIFLALSRYRGAPQPAAAGTGLHRYKLPPLAAPRPKPAAAAASSKESHMKWFAIAQALGLQLAAGADEAAARAAVVSKLALSASATDDEIAAALVARSQASGTGVEQPQANGLTRTQEVEQMFAQAERVRPNDAGLRLMQATALINRERPVAEIRAELLAAMANGAQSVAGQHVAVEPGEDAKDKRRAAMSQAVLARVGIGKPDAANEFRGSSLLDLAESCLVEAGVKTTRMNKKEIAEAALGKGKHVRGAGGGAPHTTSDFPEMLERSIERMVLTGFTSQPSTWETFSRLGDVSDFREYKRMVPAVIGTLEEVNEAGEYKNMKLPDLAGNPIKAKRHGNIIAVTPELLINDDIGYIQSLADGLGRTGNRTIERAVYALLNSNPVLKDGNALFSAAHGNLANPGTAIGVETLDAARTAMMLQKAPGEVNDEYLDIVPKILLAHVGIAGKARVVVTSQYDPDAENKLQRGNMVYNMVEQIVPTPRLPQLAWYLFADPNVAPVIEVVFLNGQREPEITQDEDFRTSGLAWKVELPFGVGAIDFRGGYKNPGA